MALRLAHRADRPTERVVGDESPGQVHSLGDEPESGDVHPNSGDAGFLDSPRYVSDRHVAYRSDGHQQKHVDLCFVEHLDPVRQDVLSKPPLRCRARE